MEAMSSTEQSPQNGLVGGLAISQLVGEEDHDRGGAEETCLKRRVWVETKKLWHLVGPAILSRICAATFAVVTQAFAGHLGDVELASISIVNTVILGFCFGLVTGMSSALDTLCGQAFGAKSYHMLGIHLQRSCIVLLLCSCLLLPIYIFTTPILKLLGQPHDVAVQSGLIAVWSIPQHMSFAFVMPGIKFLQAQLKPGVYAWVTMGTLGVHVATSWLFMYKFRLGVVGIAVASDISWWILVVGTYGYILCGGCPETWTGFSVKAFSGLWDFFKLSAASGVMLCLENWYYRILVLMAGHLKNSTLALDALLVCMNVNAWEMMIPISFFAAIGVRVANELGAGNGKGAKFATKVSVGQSLLIGILFSLLIILFHHKLAMIFSSSHDVIQAVGKLSYLLALTILFNSVQPVLSGVAVGSGWQSYVAYINIGCYYLIGIPVGLFLGSFFNFGVKGIWGGMIFGTAAQTTILAIITIFCDWEKEAQKAVQQVKHLASPNPDDDHLMVEN
ncbi:protein DETOXIFICATION 27-like [Rhododendron vialii]|uniref:protein DETOXIFICATION 27-like n=1 Tax=Rhododendron vialii TaxID=182163 RepID=UPI00265DF80C|nr:protein DETOXIFICATION 27-like [Rhododendron vialii]